MAYGVVDILYQWESIGVFDYIFPFMLIFAIVYGIMSKTKFLGDNKGVNVIIAIVLGFLSLRWNFLGDFLSELAPRLGVGITVLLTLFILVGLFIAKDESRVWGWVLAASGIAVFLIVITKSFSYLGWSIGGIGVNAADYGGFILLGILIVGLIIAVAAAGGKGGDKQAFRNPSYPGGLPG
jgi:hypothetical protein